MKTKNYITDFKAVDFQRQRRKELNDLYSSNPTKFLKELQAIRKKYANKFRTAKKHVA